MIVRLSGAVVPDFGCTEMGIGKSKSTIDTHSELVIAQRREQRKQELLVAIYEGQLSKVRQLSLFRSVLNSVDDEKGTTHLHTATQLGKLDIVRCLIKAGIDVNKKDKSMMCALHIAATNGFTQIAEAILQSRACVFKDEKDIWGWTPLHRAVINRHEQTAIMLLNYGASINVPDESKRVTLHVAAGDGQVAFVKRLLSIGAKVDWQDSRMRTPLYLAVVGRQVEVVKALVDHGCNLDLPTVAGLTPLHLAIKKGMTDIVEVLINGGAKSVPQSSFPGNIEEPLLVHLITLGAGNNGMNKKSENYLQIACLLIKQDSTPLPKGTLDTVLRNYSLDHPHHSLLNQLIRLILLSGINAPFTIPDTLPKTMKHDLEEWCQGHLHPNVPPLMEICRIRVRRCLHRKYKNVIYSVRHLKNIPPVLKDFILLQA